MKAGPIRRVMPSFILQTKGEWTDDLDMCDTVKELAQRVKHYGSRYPPTNRQIRKVSSEWPSRRRYFYMRGQRVCEVQFL